jgi:hypothetical protein
MKLFFRHKAFPAIFESLGLSSGLHLQAQKRDGSFGAGISGKAYHKEGHKGETLEKNLFIRICLKCLI